MRRLQKERLVSRLEPDSVLMQHNVRLILEMVKDIRETETIRDSSGRRHSLTARTGASTATRPETPRSARRRPSLSSASTTSGREQSGSIGPSQTHANDSKSSRSPIMTSTTYDPVF